MKEKMNIKEKIKRSGLNQWEIAEYLNVGETTLCRWLRKPEKLSQKIIGDINSAIDKLSKNGEVG